MSLQPAAHHEPSIQDTLQTERERASEWFAELRDQICAAVRAA